MASDYSEIIYLCITSMSSSLTLCFKPSVYFNTKCDSLYLVLHLRFNRNMNKFRPQNLNMQEVITQAENKMSVEWVKKNLFACEEYVKGLTSSSLRGLTFDRLVCRLDNFLL